MGLEIRPIELRDANAFIIKHHRHHKPVKGHRFSISAWKDDKLVGVAINGRPVARGAGHPLEVLEVSRLCTDGTKNVCSFLYSASARIAKTMGYSKIQTYIIYEAETGISLKASGWVMDKERTRGGKWTHTNPPGPRRTDKPNVPKQRWAKLFKSTLNMPYQLEMN